MRVSYIAAAVILSTVMSSGAQQAPDLRTRAETSNYEETSTYADVDRVMAGLAASSPLVYRESFGKTEQGRDMPLMVISDPRVATPDAARRLGRPVVFVQANIHAGEVEGKEAILMLARRLVSGDLKPLTRQLVILIAPDYNADGNEKLDVMNRTAQNGPVGGVGTRENSKGLDLNRDYMKLDSLEARALVGLMNKWDPHVLVDLHTTNGSYHANHLTYSPILNPNADERLIAFSRDHMLPEIRRVMLDKHKWRTYYYGNFAPEDGGGRESSRVDPANPGNITWRTFDHRPRFGNNYAGLRNRIAILSEAYSYLDFKGRVEVTEDFVEEVFRSAVSHAKTITALTAQADRQFTAPPNARPVLSEARALTGSPRRVEGPVELGVDFEIRSAPQKVDILVGDVKKVPNPRSGREMNAMTDMAVVVPMKEYGTFMATRSLPMPKGWVIPANPRLAAALDRLRWHGVQLREIADEAQVPVERFSIADYTRSERAFQGHREARLKGSFDKIQLTVAPGAFFVPANQPLARLAFYLLEAESDDGLVTWNVIEEGLAAGQTYPIYRVMDATALGFKSRN